VDCHALLAVLGELLPTSGQSGLAKIIAMSSIPSYRLQATNAPFEAKDLLKARAYRWNAEQKVWHTRLADEAQLTAELTWLKSAVYTSLLARVQVEKLNADVKYSSRSGELSSQQI
jgi:DNA polymerase-3 subunit epsilon